MPPPKIVGFGVHKEQLRRARARLAKTNQPTTHSQTRYATSTITTGVGSISSTSLLPLPPQPLPLLPLPPLSASSPTGKPSCEHDSQDDKASLEDTEPVIKKATQTSETLQEFLENVPTMLDIMLDHAVDRMTGSPCSCNVEGAIRTTQCYDCQAYLSSCTDCFLRAHRHLPLHWAEVWDFEQGFFVRHDIATLKPDISSINLGHSGAPCPSRHAENLFFTAVDANGIHKTKIRFCTCEGESRFKQLMHVRLFPATVSQPVTAFTFNVLHQFHIHHLESKESAHDFIGSLRRMTDNAFPQHIKDITPQFRAVIRVWRLLKASKRLGVALDIENVLPHRREFIVHCPVCPDPRVNMEPGWQDTPIDLCHLNQTQFLADGNHHSNRYLKNTDPDDISLYNGRSYFPEDTAYRKYVDDLPKKSPEKSGPCDHLTAINAQDRKKFKNMDITGIVNINCSHIFIKSSVDLQLGEKFANTDYALAHAIRNTKPTNPDELTSLDEDFVHKCDHRGCYDIACGFGIHAEERFRSNFAPEADFVKNTKWLIPALHVHNHRDNCTYLYSSAYQENTGRLIGESVEQPWIELNQLAPQTRQMNNGNRQDTISDHHSHWNWTKTADMAATICRDIATAKALFDQKRSAFESLCLLYVDKIPIWNALDRSKRVIVNKEIQCVYRQNDLAVPSRTRIYEALISELDASGDKHKASTSMPSFLNEGISIAEEQRNLHAHVLAVRQGTLKTDITRTRAARDKALASELQSKRSRLDTRISKWRKLQKLIAPQLGDLIIQDAISGKSADKPENETLFMPSDLSRTQRKELDLESLGEMEYRLQEGLACDAIQSLRTIIKVHGALVVDKITHSKGQKQNTRSNTQIEEVKKRRDEAISDYSYARRAMIKLGGISEDSPLFPPLSIHDTVRNNTNSKRALGDSRRMEGGIWTNATIITNRPGSVPGPALPSSSTATRLPPTIAPAFGTQLATTKPLELGHKRGPKGTKRQIDGISTSTPHEDRLKKNKEGWIWSFRPREKMSDKEVEEWMSEGDRVQWFRAEADMKRWQEELEIKQADFLRCIRSFRRMSEVWTELSKTWSTKGSAEIGRVSYAKRHAAMFRQMESDAKALLTATSYGELLSLETNESFVAHIRAERLKHSITALQPKSMAG